MDTRAGDILDLKKILDDALSDDLLNSRAIEIYERLIEAKKNIRYRVDVDEAKLIDAQILDFIALIKEIKRRRSDKVLERFDFHVKKIGGDITTE